MLIAIDASRAISEQPTGTELYSARLIEYMAKIDTENTYYLYTPTPPPAHFPKLPDNWHWKVIPFPRLWSQVRLSIALFIDKPDLLFVPAHVLPLYVPNKSVTTVHDIAYEVFPEAYSKFSLWYLRYSVNRAAKLASAIITPSQATADDIERVYGIPANQITITPLGFDHYRFSEPVSIPEKIKRLQPYFLMIGRLEARKNTARVVEAFGQLRADNPDLNDKLILLGKPGHGYQAVDTAINQLPPTVKKDVIRPGYVSDAEASAYLAGATGFLYPSLYEGFGLAVLEAMAAGVPAVTSETSSMPEVVGDDAILVDPSSTTEITKAMKILATNDLSREEIAKRGLERAKLFSWEKTAQQTLAVFEKVMKK